MRKFKDEEDALTCVNNYFHLLFDHPYLIAEEEYIATYLPWLRRSMWYPDNWALISDENKEMILEADRVFIKNIDVALEWWIADAYVRDRNRIIDEINKKMWFEWLDLIRKGRYPWKYIPDHLKDLCEPYYTKELTERDFTEEELAEIDILTYTEQVFDELEECPYEVYILIDLPVYHKKVDIALKIIKSKELKDLVVKADRKVIDEIDDVLLFWEYPDIYEDREKRKGIVENDKWYWWIDKIREGRFPWEYIPDHLKDLCKKFYKKKGIDREKEAKRLPEYYYKMLCERLDYFLDKEKWVLCLPFIRQNIAEVWDIVSKERKERVIQADKVLIKNLKKVESAMFTQGFRYKRTINIGRIERDEWYYWLDKIKEKKFPLRHIPDHLKDVCEKYYESRV